MLATNKIEKWKPIIEDWLSSGQNQKEYCQSNGYNYSVFGYWRKKVLGENKSLKKDQEELQVVCYQVDDTSKVTIELEADQLRVPIGNKNGFVTITGKLTLKKLSSIVSACAKEDGASDHVSA